ncbi:MAG: hypothetical protein O7B80_04410 [bacterium]|nr:hypothetical protein [bacterium]
MKGEAKAQENGHVEDATTNAEGGYKSGEDKDGEVDHYGRNLLFGEYSHGRLLLSA